MYALLFTFDGRGGRFYTFEGTTVVAMNDIEKQYLKNIARSEGGQLVELNLATWMYDTICVHEIQSGMLQPIAA